MLDNEEDNNAAQTEENSLEQQAMQVKAWINNIQQTKHEESPRVPPKKIGT